MSHRRPYRWARADVASQRIGPTLVSVLAAAGAMLWARLRARVAAVRSAAVCPDGRLRADAGLAPLPALPLTISPLVRAWLR